MKKHALSSVTVWGLVTAAAGAFGVPAVDESASTTALVLQIVGLVLALVGRWRKGDLALGKPTAAVPMFIVALLATSCATPVSTQTGAESKTTAPVSTAAPVDQRGSPIFLFFGVGNTASGIGGAPASGDVEKIVAAAMKGATQIGHQANGDTRGLGKSESGQTDEKGSKQEARNDVKPAVGDEAIKAAAAAATGGVTVVVEKKNPPVPPAPEPPK